MTGVQTCALPICFPVTISHVLIRAAWKLYDGSYVFHSEPIYWHCGYDPAGDDGGTPGTNNENSSGYLPFILAGKPGVSYLTPYVHGYSIAKLRLGYCFTQGQFDDIQKYIDSRVIQSLCFFMSEPVSSYDLTKDSKNWNYTWFNNFAWYHFPWNRTEVKQLYDNAKYYQFIS